MLTRLINKLWPGGRRRAARRPFRGVLREYRPMEWEEFYARHLANSSEKTTQLLARRKAGLTP